MHNIPTEEEMRTFLLLTGRWQSVYSGRNDWWYIDESDRLYRTYTAYLIETEKSDLFEIENEGLYPGLFPLDTDD